jgi:hypothetical protein
MAKSFIPAPPNADEKSFDIGDKLTVFDAAMVYAGRHPHPRFLKDGSIDDHLEFLLAGIPKQPRSRNRLRARRSWDIYCELVERIKRGLIRPIKPAYDLAGQVDPIRTVIQTSDLAKLATERGDRPRYLRHAQSLLPCTVEVSQLRTADRALRPASKAAIHSAISAEYDEAASVGRKPPNLTEIAKPVQSRLLDKGFSASGRLIQELAGAEEHARRRRKPGRTLASEKLRPSFR